MPTIYGQSKHVKRLSRQDVQSIHSRKTLSGRQAGLFLNENLSLSLS